MAFTSVDNIVSNITAGNTLKMVTGKVAVNAAAFTAGQWMNVFQANGNPGIPTTTGTPGTAFQYTEGSTNQWYHGGNVGGTKHILNLMAFTPTTTMCPATAILCDFLVCYPSLLINATPSTITAAALPRYTDGAGVEVITVADTLNGATQPAITWTYKDQNDNNRVAPTALQSPQSAAAAGMLYQDAGAGGSPFMRKLTGYPQVKSLVSYTLATGTGTGTASAYLVKPLAQIPIFALNTATERDCVFQMPSLPRIVDGANLGFIVNVGGAAIAAARFQAIMDIGWTTS